MRLLIIAVLSASLLACGKTEEKPPVKLFESQRQQLQDAKAVEQTVQQAAQQQRDNLEKQEAGEAAK